MLVLLVLGLVAFARWRSIPDDRRRARLAFCIVASVLLHAIALLVLFEETARFPQYLGTTGSDSLDYLSAARSLLLGNQSVPRALDEFAGGYAVFCYAILGTSPTPSPLLVVACNVVLFQIVLIGLEDVMHRSEFGPRATLLSLVFLTLNGAMIWTSIRILKDVLFFALVLEAFRAIVDWPRRWRLNAPILVGACVWMAFIRPHSYVLVVGVSLLARALQARAGASLRGDAPRRLLVGAGAVLALVALVFLGFQEAIEDQLSNYLRASATQAVQDAQDWGSRSSDLFEQDPVRQVAVGFLRFFMLPVPISTLVARTEFRTYSVLLFAGSSLGLLTLGYSIRSLTRIPQMIRDGRALVVALAAMALAMSITYIVLFSGNAEARHRFPFYAAFALIAGDRIGNGQVCRREHVVVVVAFLCINAAYLVMG